MIGDRGISYQRCVFAVLTALAGAQPCHAHLYGDEGHAVDGIPEWSSELDVLAPPSSCPAVIHSHGAVGRGISGTLPTTFSSNFCQSPVNAICGPKNGNYGMAARPNYRAGQKGQVRALAMARAGFNRFVPNAFSRNAQGNYGINDRTKVWNYYKAVDAEVERRVRTRFRTAARRHPEHTAVSVAAFDQRMIENKIRSMNFTQVFGAGNVPARIRTRLLAQFRNSGGGNLITYHSFLPTSYNNNTVLTHYANNCGPNGMVRNAFNFRWSNGQRTIMFCPGLILDALEQSGGDFSKFIDVLIFSAAHEVAHTISAETRTPFNSGLYTRYQNCLKTEYGLANSDYVSELSADYWAAERVAERIRHRNSTAKLDTLRRAYGMLCLSAPSKWYPSGRTRIEKILRGNPSINRVMGCNRSGVSRSLNWGCDLSGRVYLGN